MRLIVVALLAVVAAIATVEGAYRLRGDMTQDAQAAVTGIVIAAQCPDVPAAKGVANANAYTFAAKHPLQLPPWHVFMISANDQDAAEPNLFATGLCQEIISRQ